MPETARFIGIVIKHRLRLYRAITAMAVVAPVTRRPSALPHPDPLIDAAVEVAAVEFERAARRRDT